MQKVACAGCAFVAASVLILGTGLGAEIQFSHNLAQTCDLAERIVLTEKRLASSPYTVEFTAAVAGGAVRFDLQTAYPSVGEAKLVLRPDQERTFEVAIRIPRWALGPAVTVNGETQAVKVAEGSVALKRAWHAGDTVGVSFPVGLRIEDGRGNDLLTLKYFGKEPCAGYLFHGPLLQGADTQRNTALPETLRLSVAKMQDFRLSDAQAALGRFSVKGTHCRLPSETTGQEGAAVLAPIAEFTGYGEWKDELSGFERNGEKPTKRPEARTCQSLFVTPSTM